jgi:GH24 family phage-related lysozyme (muramidase)
MLIQDEPPTDVTQGFQESWLRDVYGKLEVHSTKQNGVYSLSLSEYYQTRLRKWDLDGDQKLSGYEIWRGLHCRESWCREIVQRLLVKHHSEWLHDADSTLWKPRLAELSKRYPAVAQFNQTYINALVWMKEVPEIRSAEALWHMHPLMFLDAITERFSDTINFQTSLGIYKISKKSANLILKAEGYQRAPYVPQGSNASGVTIGYGYDLGQQTASKMRAMLSGYFTGEQLNRLEATIGLKGGNASAVIPSLSDITISEEKAISLAMKMKSKYAQIVVDTYPEVLNTHPHCQGAMLSLIINRGTSFKKPNVASRIEMKNIHDDFISGNLNNIPNQFRSMKRLWLGQGLDGLITRREDEAKLFEEGLSQ